MQRREATWRIRAVTSRIRIVTKQPSEVTWHIRAVTWRIRIVTRQPCIASSRPSEVTPRIRIVTNQPRIASLPPRKVSARIRLVTKQGCIATTQPSTAGVRPRTTTDRTRKVAGRTRWMAFRYPRHVCTGELWTSRSEISARCCGERARGRKETGITSSNPAPKTSIAFNRDWRRTQTHG
jgi:hypothetical protein